jgi:hypothetical protein
VAPVRFLGHRGCRAGTPLFTTNPAELRVDLDGDVSPQRIDCERRVQGRSEMAEFVSATTSGGKQGGFAQHESCPDQHSLTSKLSHAYIVIIYSHIGEHRMHGFDRGSRPADVTDRGR